MRKFGYPFEQEVEICPYIISKCLAFLYIKCYIKKVIVVLGVKGEYIKKTVIANSFTILKYVRAFANRKAES